MKNNSIHNKYILYIPGIRNLLPNNVCLVLSKII